MVWYGMVWFGLVWSGGVRVALAFVVVFRSRRKVVQVFFGRLAGDIR